MMRQFELVRGKLELHWEIERDGCVVHRRSWGRNREEYRETKRHRSEAAARRTVQDEIEFQLARGFVETGAGAKAATPRLLPQGREAVAAAKTEIVSTTIPALRALGFKGTFPNFHRVDADRHLVVAFWWGRAQASVTVLLGVVAPRVGATPAEDLRRAINIRNRQRVSIRDVTRHRDWVLLGFAEAAQKWGVRWAPEVALLLKKVLEKNGMAWLLAPERRPKRVTRGRHAAA
jgi:hypothetical protein